MRLPELQSPEQYTGLYVFDFGDQVAVGYTADEVAVLFESDKYKDGKAYRIHRALPDGTMEMQGVARERFQAEEGMFFYRTDMNAGRQDFEDLRQLAKQTPPPCRMKLQLASLERKEGDLADKSPVTSETFMTVLIYPAEYSHDVATWLNDADYQGGDYVEGGASMVTNYYGMGATILDREQLWPVSRVSRSAEEVLATTHQSIQRRMAG